MLSVENVAIPATAATVRVPDSTALAGPVPGVIATVTLPVKPVAVLPSASRAVTWTGGAIAWPAGPVVGWTVNASTAAAPAVMLNDALTAPVRPLAVAVRVYPVPARSMLKVENVATPATAATVRVPDSVAPGVPLPPVIVSVMLLM